MSGTDRAALWQRLVDKGFVEGEMPAAGVPQQWFVRVMLGVSGWLGALFLVAFVMFFVANSESMTMMGVISCAAAAMLIRRFGHLDAAVQFGLAISLTGQMLVLFGFERTAHGEVMTLAMTTFFMQAALFFAIPNTIHRVWSAWTGTVACAVVLAETGYGAMAPGITAFAFIHASIAELERPAEQEIWQAVSTGLAVALVALVTIPYDQIMHHGDHGGAPVTHGGRILVALSVIYAIYRLLVREEVSLSSAAAKATLAAAVAIGLLSLKATGIGPTIIILIMGYANSNRPLAGFGLLSMVAYLTYYYYALEMTLLEKSIVMASAGVALLLLRFVVRRLGLSDARMSRA